MCPGWRQHRKNSLAVRSPSLIRSLSFFFLFLLGLSQPTIYDDKSATSVSRTFVFACTCALVQWKNRVTHITSSIRRRLFMDPLNHPASAGENSMHLWARRFTSPSLADAREREFFSVWPFFLPFSVFIVAECLVFRDGWDWSLGVVNCDACSRWQDVWTAPRLCRLTQ